MPADTPTDTPGSDPKSQTAQPDDSPPTVEALQATVATLVAEIEWLKAERDPSGIADAADRLVSASETFAASIDAAAKKVRPRLWPRVVGLATATVIVGGLVYGANKVSASVEEARHAVAPIEGLQGEANSLGETINGVSSDAGRRADDWRSSTDAFTHEISRWSNNWEYSQNPGLVLSRRYELAIAGKATVVDTQDPRRFWWCENGVAHVFFSEDGFNFDTKPEPGKTAEIC